MDWFYSQPVDIYFGRGKTEILPELLKGFSKPVIVCDSFFEGTGVLERIRRLTGAAAVYSDISPNPDVSEVNRCSELLRKAGADVIAAVGGGSAIDTAKAASLTAEDISEYHGTGKAVPGTHLPVIAVPTTAGTGSEVTCVSVLTDRSTGRKAPINSDSFYPAAAVIDPELTLTVPPAVTASTGIDVLCHAIEGYWSIGHQPICDALAVHAASLVLDHLPRAVSAPDDINAREKLAEASVIAGLAFTLPKTTGAHACSFPLTAIWGIPHGEACALTLDSFIRINAEDPHTGSLARKLGFGDPQLLADHIAELKKRIGLRMDLADLRLNEEQIRELVQKSRHPNLLNNPVEVTDGMLYEMYKRLSKIERK
ncbi:MAG: iron-containing alcohol dehydrogenase [Ruminococcus sp.]|nr:iron-containing alcohol dehydrogenase [Ruminococcus sp.]